MRVTLHEKCNEAKITTEKFFFLFTASIAVKLRSLLSFKQVFSFVLYHFPFLKIYVICIFSKSIVIIDVEFVFLKLSLNFWVSFFYNLPFFYYIIVKDFKTYFALQHCYVFYVSDIKENNIKFETHNLYYSFLMIKLKHSFLFSACF